MGIERVEYTGRQTNKRVIKPPFDEKLQSSEKGEIVIEVGKDNPDILHLSSIPQGKNSWETEDYSCEDINNGKIAFGSGADAENIVTYKWIPNKK